MPLSRDPRVLVDFRTSDDAGVYAWEGGPALVQTVDFFTPIVDDPCLYGQIAAANSLSDVYAMGGRPLTALAIAGFPAKGIDKSVIAAIFRGGYDKLSTSRLMLLEEFGIDLESEKERLVFAGDSPNDQPMFACFPNSVGVANVRRMADLMTSLPRYVTPSEGSAGFAELADAVLAARDGGR